MKERKAGKPPASALAALAALEMIEQQEGWEDQPVFFAAAKEQLASVRPHRGFWSSVDRIRGIFADV